MRCDRRLLVVKMSKMLMRRGVLNERNSVLCHGDELAC